MCTSYLHNVYLEIYICFPVKYGENGVEKRNLSYVACKITVIIIFKVNITNKRQNTEKNHISVWILFCLLCSFIQVS